MNKTNAEGLKAAMEGDGYMVHLARNDQDMYRVIVFTDDSKFEAAQKRDQVKARYKAANKFQDSWILIKK